MIDLIEATPPVAEVVDVVYRMDLELGSWLRALREVVAGDQGLPTMAVLFRPCDRVEEVVAQEADPVADRIMHEICTLDGGGQRTPEASPGTLSGTQSEVMGLHPLPDPYGAAYLRAGISDIWAVMGRSPCGVTLCCSRLLPRRARSTARARRYWDAVAMHFAAAARLRLALSSPSEAVLGSDGTLLHAEGAARERDHRQSLRRAVRAIDRARAGREDPLVAIESWTALVEGRWSLVDQFESDGRRFVVARVNEPRVAGNARLSARERQVVALAALGRSNKQIAYDMGLGITTVASYLRRAARKLGVSTRAELIASGPRS